MSRKSKVFTMILSVSLFLAGAEGALSSNINSRDMLSAAAEGVQTSGQPEYDDLYALRVEVTKNPTSSYYSSGSPDFSGLELSVYRTGKDGDETEVLSSTTLEEVEKSYDVNIIENPGGGTFTITVSAYSTALARTVSGKSEFAMKVIQNTNLESLKLEITNLPLNNTKYVDDNLDLTGLTLSVWEVYADGSEEETFTDADLESIKDCYYVDVTYNDGEGICVIRIYSYINEREVATTCDFTYIIVDPRPVTNGDVNEDGYFNVSDVVLLQKWLLAVPNTHLANWEAANFYEDDRLDVFDLCLMKRKLISQNDEFIPCTATIDDDFMPYVVVVTIKKQFTTDPLRSWTIDDFNNVNNINSVSDATPQGSDRQVLYIMLDEPSKENVLKLIQEIENLNIPDVHTVRTVNWESDSNVPS